MSDKTLHTSDWLRFTVELLRLIVAALAGYAGGNV